MTASPLAPATAAPASDLDARVLRAQVALLYDNIRQATLGEAALAWSFGAFMYWQTGLWIVLVWIALHVYNTARLPVLTARFKDPHAEQRAQYWADTFCDEMRSNSLTWGLAPMLFLPDELPLIALMMLIMMGLCLAGLTAVAPLMRTAYNFMLPMITCLMLALLVRPSTLNFFLAATCVIFGGTVLWFAKTQNDLLVTSLRSRFEKEALAQQLALQVRATEEASQQKTRFLAAASHDLRQPMHAIALLGAALEKQLDGKPERVNAERLLRAVKTLSHSLDTMLDVSRLDAGVIKPQPRTIALQELFQSLNQNFVNRASEKEIQLRVRATDLWVRSDPQLLRRMLSNLIDNAVKYTRRGGVLVLARHRAAPSVTAEEAWIEIYDTGIGIAPEQQSRVYEEFYQVNNPGRDRALGLGIGLSVVARLSRLLRHPIELRSTAGRGTRFRLRLPAVAAPTPVPAPTADVHAGVMSAEPRLPERVLVLDDEADVRTAMGLLLRSHGVDAHMAANKAEAVRALAAADQTHTPFSLLICDFRLADGVDGLHVGQELARRFASLPLLLVTGETAPARLQRVRDAGVPVLFKPVTSERLLHAMVTTAR